MILFVGRLTPAKGIVNLVKAMPTVISRYPEVKLAILGRGELEKTILDLISRLGIADNVKPNCRISSLYQKRRGYYIMAPATSRSFLLFTSLPVS